MLRCWLILCLILPFAPALGAAPHDDSSVVVRAWFDDVARLEQVAARLGHAQIDRHKGLLRTEADAALRDALVQAGFRVEIDTEASDRVNAARLARAGDKSIPGYACYRSVEETDNEIAALAGAYPNLLELRSVGHSWQALAGNPGYALRVAVATNREIDVPKPVLFLLSSIHAREYAPAELATRFIEDLVLGYGQDPEATWLLDHHEVHALLQGNPDGRKLAETGLSWRKNHNTTHCGSGNSAGVDLNRNFPFQWGQHGGSSGASCDSTYRGPAPTSEPETQAVVNYVAGLFVDRRGPGLNDPAPLDTQGMFIDIHSFSRLVLWPWGFTTTPAPNGAALAKLGRRLAWFNGYTAEQAIGLYPTDGTTDDFAYGELGVPAYTFELGTAFFQDCASFENTIVPHNNAALRYAARTLRAPYRLPFGPDAFALSVEPDLALAGEPVRVQATFDDARMQTQVTGASGPVPAVQAVQSASLFVAVPPWSETATAVSMLPLDGAFDGSREAAQIEFDSSDLGTGQHLVYVQARDADGNDGPPNAAFVEVVAAQDAVQLHGVVRQVGTQIPLAAEIRSGRFVSHSDPVSGQYRRVLPAGLFDLEVSAPGHETGLWFGLNGPAGSNIQRDIALFRLCSLLQDPAEPEFASPLQPAAPWSLRSGAGIDGGAAWMPSASGNYAANLNVSLSGPTLDLAEYESPILSFDSRCATESGYDFGRVEISVDGGANWIETFRCDGDPSWKSIELALPALGGASQARFRFRFSSDSVVSAPGWAIDNIRLDAGGPACRASQTPAPEAVTILHFNAAPAQILAGEASILSWQTEHATACRIEQEGGAADVDLATDSLAAGQIEVTPQVNTTYTLACSGSKSTAQATTAVEVSVPPPMPLLRDGFEIVPPAPLH